jgi:hypothetical protein
MVRNAARKRLTCTCNQVDVSALTMLQAKESQELVVVWKVRYIQSDRFGEEGFEGCLAMKQAAG